MKGLNSARILGFAAVIVVIYKTSGLSAATCPAVWQIDLLAVFHAFAVVFFFKLTEIKSINCFEQIASSTPEVLC